MYTKRPISHRFRAFFVCFSVVLEMVIVYNKRMKPGDKTGLRHCSPAMNRGFRNNVVQKYKVYIKSLRMDASYLHNHVNIGFLYRMNKTRTAKIDAAIAHVHTFERLLAFATSLCFFSLWTVALSLVVA